MFFAELLGYGKQRKCIGVFRSDSRIALQLIANALEEARNDFAEVGRPLTFRVHDGHYSSLLSDAKDKPVKLTGLVNLLIMLLLITNIKNIL